MHAFDYVTVLFSFVYALAIAHVLATAGDMLRAGRRLILSWFNAGWMLLSLVCVVAWWIGVWDLRAQKVWDMGTIGYYFVMACALYLQARLACPPIPADGPVDLQAYHRREGRKYTTAGAIVALATAITNAFGGQAQGLAAWSAQNQAIIPMVLAATAAAVFTRHRWVQALALLVQGTMWVWYFAALQPPLVEQASATGLRALG